MQMLIQKQAKKDIEQTILDHVKSNDEIIYGSYALMKFLPPRLQREANDIDVWSGKPKKSSHNLEEKLEKNTRRDTYKVHVLPIAGESGKEVYRIVEKTVGKEEDIADYSEVPDDVGPKDWKKIDGIKYEAVEHAKKKKMENLKDPSKKHRWSKDKKDLQRIKAYERGVVQGINEMTGRSFFGTGGLIW